MASTDPAVAAAKRAAGTLRTSDMIRAAREALAPIKAIHRPYECGQVHDGGITDPCTYRSCFGCSDDWPCATAKLIYPTEELSE